RVQKPRDDEIGELYDGFNSMLEQIQKREQERDTVQAALIQSEAILKKAQEISEIGSYEWNVLGNSLIWSDEMFRIYGVDKNTFQPTIEKVVELTRLDDRKKIQEAIEQTIVNKKVQRIEYRILCPGGTEKVVLVDGEATLDDHGNLKKIVGFVQDVTERKEAEKAVQKTSKQLRALATHLQSVREEERTTIAREMHDELGQDLTAFKMDLTFLEKQIQSGKKKDSDHLRSINDLKIFIDETVHKVRSLIRYLRPEVLDDLGLIEALQWQAQEFKSRSGIDIKFKSNIKKIKVDKNTSTALFRIFQEALTNITRHARATQVDVNIEKKERIFSLKVTDNGVGISSDIGDKSKSFGLLGMKERALMLGGEVEVNGADGKGTTVKARIPIK
ncbi:MAG: PAS domain-containing protein, partial [Bacteroidetes bacterium]|nr:PAS domain-containing protein [Bacteroidota bacterium]